MIVLIDNYDSFTFNLVHYLGGLGADVTVHRNDKIAADDVIAAYDPWFNIARWREAEGWVLLAGARREDAA